MKKSLLLAMAVVATACSKDSGTTGATVPSFNKNSVVNNELLVKGDKEEIGKALDRMKISSSDRHITNVFPGPDDGYYSVTYKGNADLQDVMEAVAEKAQSVEPNRI